MCHLPMQIYSPHHRNSIHRAVTGKKCRPVTGVLHESIILSINSKTSIGVPINRYQIKEQERISQPKFTVMNYSVRKPKIIPQT